MLLSATLVVPSHPECLYKELETRNFAYLVELFHVLVVNQV